MDEHKEEGGSAGNFTEHKVEASGEHVDVKAETLGGGSQLGEVNNRAKESCNINYDMVETSDSRVCNDASVCHSSSVGDGENPNDGENHGEPGFDTTLRNLEAKGGIKDDSGSKGKPEEENTEKAEKTVNSVGDEETDERAKRGVETKNGGTHDGAERAEKMVSSVGDEVTDERLKLEVEVTNGEACDGENGAEAKESIQSADSGECLVGNVENITAVERDLGKAQDQVAGRTSDGGEGKESAEKSEDENKEMDIDCEDAIQEEKSEKVGVLQNETENPGFETANAKPSVTVETPNMQIQVIETACSDAEHNSAVATCPKEQVNVTDEGENKAGAVEIDSVDRDLSIPEEEKVEKVEKVGGSAENVDGKESSDAKVVHPQTQAVSIAEAGQDVSNMANEMAIEKQDAEGQQDNAETTDGIKSTDSADHEGATEEAVTGDVEVRDHNVLLDPKSDIVKFIDFSGVLSWPGNVQDKDIDIRTVPVEQSDEDIKKTEKVTDVDGHEGLSLDTEVQGSAESIQESKLENSRDKSAAPDATLSDTNTVEEMEIEKQIADTENSSLHAEGGNEVKEQSDQSHVVAEGSKEVSNSNLDTSISSLGNDKNLEAEGEQVGEQVAKAEESTDKKTDEQEGATHDTPAIDPSIGQDMEIEEQQVVDAQHFSEETGSDGKVNDRKRKADSLGEDSPQEGRKTISMAKVSLTPQFPKPSFKIGECIARAASQMAGSPSILKGTNLVEETLSPENLLSQLHLAAIDPAKGQNVSDIVTGFFLDYRNLVVPEQHIADRVCGKRNRPSNSNIGSSEAFEFEDMSDTYWTDRVIHNGGEEERPSSEKGSYQIVPVELKPAQIQRGRRPYTRRRYSDNNNNNPPSAGEKPVGYDENSPAELIMNFSEMDTLPSETNLSKMFRHFGPIRESQTEVDRDSSRARVVFRKSSDAEVAYNSAGKFNIFGSKVVQYELNYTITEHFKIQPYVVSLGEEDAALCLPSHS